MRCTVDNKTVNATMAGGSLDTAGPAVVLVHGAGMNRTCWQLQTRYLSAHNVRAIAVDLPGHGRSDGPALDSVAALAQWTAQLIATLDLGPTHLVGHSMGALVAAQTAADLGEAVTGVSLLGAAAAMGVHPELQAAADANDPLAADLITSWGHGTEAHTGQHRQPGAWALGGSTHLLRRSPAGSLGTDLALCAAYDSMLAVASRLTCTVQLILGRQDKMTPRKAAQPLIDVFAARKTAELEVHELDCGHMMMWERPTAVRKLLFSAISASN